MSDDLPNRDPGATWLPPLDPEPFWSWNAPAPSRPPLRNELTELQWDSIQSILSGETPEQWQERRLAEGEPIRPGEEGS
jgi:hypothetical protein